ncbi:MAG: hypothetical protein HY021_00115, partial [Burkholderiales bacterium]|nr:hypothetical protein [Burkholderiales bacterium]
MNSRPAPLDRIAHELGLALPAGVREQVAHEQLRMVLTHTRFGTLAATMFAMLMAWQMHGTVSPQHVQAWVIVKLAVAAGRIALAHAYQRYGGDSSRWQRWTLGLLAIDGLVWGVAGFRLMSEPITTVAVVVAALDAVTCVATFGLQVRL